MQKLDSRQLTNEKYTLQELLFANDMVLEAEAEES